MNTSENIVQKHQNQLEQIRQALEVAKIIVENYCPIYSNLIEYEMICGAIKNMNQLLCEKCEGDGWHYRDRYTSIKVKCECQNK